MDYLPSIKVLLAGLVGGLSATLAQLQAGQTDWRTLAISFILGAFGTGGAGWLVPELNPSPSAEKRILARNSTFRAS